MFLRALAVEQLLESKSGLSHSSTTASKGRRLSNFNEILQLKFFELLYADSRCWLCRTACMSVAYAKCETFVHGSHA